LPRKDILAKFGITDRPDLQVLIVEKHRLSMVDVRSRTKQQLASLRSQAMELSAQLRNAGEKVLGAEIASAVAKVQKTNLHRKE
jgi:hypothetical protein